MALINCSECNKKISSKVAFCPHCGNPMEQKPKKICSECNYENELSSDFCEGCGSSLKKKNKKVCSKCDYENKGNSDFCENCGNKLNVNKANSWDFDSRLLSISFLICAILATYLLSSPGFINGFPIISDNGLMGVLAIIIGIIILFVFRNKESFSFEKELEVLKKLKLSRNQVGLIFLVSGILILLTVGQETTSFDNFVYPSLGLICSFLIMIATLIIMNWDKLGWIYESITLIISIGFFGATGLLYAHGNELNNDLGSRVDSFFQSGNANPGDEYMNYAIFTLIAAIVFLILFFVMRSGKNKD